MEKLAERKKTLRKEVKVLPGKALLSVRFFLDCCFPLHSKSLSVGAFRPLKDEPELMDIPSTFTLAWPKITDSEKRLMNFFEAESFSSSSFGFEQPDGERPFSENLSCIFIPGQAFDSQGNRLGRGQGYYDRYLKSYPGIKIGVCAADRFLNKPVPAGEEDVSMDWILTDQHLFRVNKYS